MSIRSFSKMHGLGNDFIVLNALQQPFDWPRARICALADRHSGIGFDQLLIIEPAPDAAHDYRSAPRARRWKWALSAWATRTLSASWTT